MDSRLARISFLVILLLGISQPAWATVPPCEVWAQDLWEFRQQVADWTVDYSLSSVDGSLIRGFPDFCYIDEGQPLSLALQMESLQPWINSQGSQEVGDGVQALWLIDGILSDQIAAGMPMVEETRDELSAAVAERRTQLDQVLAMEFPLSTTDTITLGKAIEDLPTFRKTVEQRWHALDQVDQITVKRKLSGLERDIGQLQTDGAIYLGPLLWDTVFAISPLPAPVGEENIAQYIQFVEVVATYVALLEELEANLAEAEHPAPAVATTVDAKTLEALRVSVDPDKFREPLQIPPILGSDSSQLLTWLRNAINRLRTNSALNEGLRWMALLLCAALLGWVAYLLVGGSDQYGKRALRFRRGGPEDVVTRGRNLSPAAQFKLALEAARAGRHLEAWHWLTQGFILGLAQGELVKLDWSRTNREVLRDLHHKRVAFLDPATAFFRTAEGVVYGGRGTSLAEIEQFERSLTITLASLPKKQK